MYRNLVAIIGLVVGGFCLGALFAEDAARPGSGGATRTGLKTTGLRRTNEPRQGPQTKLSDFAGLWRGQAKDYPEDGTSTDSVSIKLSISESGQLQGTAFDEFAGGGEATLEDVYATGDRLEFKVRYRTGVQMRVTLGLAGNKLKGEGIPIRSDEDRCKITLQRSEDADQPRVTTAETEPADAKGFDGRWVGFVKDRPGKGDVRRSLIVDVAVDKRDGTLQVITMGAYQQAYDEHIDDAKVLKGKLVFQLVDREGIMTTISLWSQPGERNKLWGEAVASDDEAPVRDVELKRAHGPREYRYSGGYRRLVLDPSLLPTDTDLGGPRPGGPDSHFR